MASGERGPAGDGGGTAGSPRGRGVGAAVAGVYLLTILPVYQVPRSHRYAADSSRRQSTLLASSRGSGDRGRGRVENEIAAGETQKRRVGEGGRGGS